jgi:hypothetical protein
MGRSPEEQQRELRELLAPHVQGELLAAAPARAGGFMVQGQRFYGGLLEFLLPALFGEENGLPLNVWIAVTPDDLYVFRRKKGKLDSPLRRWPRVGLGSLQAKKWGKGVRVLARLENGRKAIFLLPGDEQPGGVCAALGISAAGAGRSDP